MSTHLDEFDFGESAVVIADADGFVTVFSPAAERLTGRSAAEVIGCGVLDVVAPGCFEGDAWRHFAVDSFTPVTTVSGDMPTRDGGCRHVDWHVGWKVRSGAVAGAAFIGRDVTDRRTEERRLRMREHLLAQSQRVGRIGSYVFDVEADRWTSSEMLDEIFGIDEEYRRDLAGWLALVVPGDRPALADYVSDLLVTRGEFDREYRIVRASDGTERWVHGRGELLCAEDGSPRTLLGTIQDVTHVHEAIAALRLSERSLRAAERVGGVGSWTRVVGSDNLDCSPQLLVILGLEPGCRIGVTEFLEIVHPEDREAVSSGVCDATDLETPRCSEYRIVRPDGAVRYLSSRCEFAPADDLTTLTEIGMITDVTDRRAADQRIAGYQSRLKRLAARLASSERTERRALAVLLHDRVSQPLAVARMRHQMLGETVGSGPLRAEHDHVSSLLLEALEASRTLTEELAPPLAYELGLIPALEWMCEQMLVRMGLEVELTVHGAPAVDADDDCALVLRMTRELLTNVVKHSGTRWCSLSVSMDAGQLVIGVSDQGLGFVADADEAQGFGLMSVREALEDREGTLVIDSVPGHGTVATMRLPVRPASCEPPAAGSALQ